MSGPSLSTHVLDTRLGQPAADVAVSLSRIDGDRVTVLAEARTDGEGRIRSLADGLVPGAYRLSFDLGAYFRARGERGLFRRITLDLEVAADGHYHVPLLVSPYGAVTYRGG